MICFFLLCATLSLVFSNPVYTSTDVKIIGGQVANAAQFPYAAAIHVQTNNGRFFCGGTLISNEWLVTAGHCVYNAILFTIQLGSNHLDSDDSNRVTVATSTYVLHPDFNPESIENDIGLIQLRMPLEFTTYLKEASIQPFTVTGGYWVFSIGWGQISDDDPELSNDLRFAFITAISNLECKMYYGDQITDNMVCVIGNFNQGTCNGDNGGALIAILGKTHTLVGVASFISANGCESTNPSGYTRLMPYLSWIQNVTSL